MGSLFVVGNAAGGGVTSAAVTMSLGPGLTVHAEVTATGGGADTALANVLDAAAAVTQPRNKWEAAMSEEAAAGVGAVLQSCWLQ